MLYVHIVFRSVVQTRHCSSCCHQTDRNRWVHGLIDNVVGHCRLLLCSLLISYFCCSHVQSLPGPDREQPSCLQSISSTRRSSSSSVRSVVAFLSHFCIQKVHLTLGSVCDHFTEDRQWPTPGLFFFFFKGAILPLTLGLIITAFLLLLFIIGCRIRLVRHKIRKARPLTTEESDYLINGMYL